MGKIWAVASNTMAQAIRLKTAGVVIVLLFVLLPLMSLTVVGDQTLQGKLQTFSSYGLSLTSILLCLLTIVISCYSLSSDIKYKHIFLVTTKPIRRYEVLLGKYLGVVILDGLLLAVFSGIVYGLTCILPILDESPEGQVYQARQEFFTSRAILTPMINEQEIERIVEERFAQLEKDGQFPENMTPERIRAELRGQERFRAKTAELGREKIWEFSGVKTRDSDDYVFIRYKYRIAGDPLQDTTFGTWRAGDYRPLKMGEYPKTRIYAVERKEATQVALEFAVPADCVAEDGYLALGFFNDPAVNTQTIILEDIKVLYRTGSFLGNYLRVMGLLFVRLIFLAALGVSVSTWLSFPIGVLICLVAYLTGMINGFVVDSIQNLHAVLNVLYTFTIRPAVWFLPKFDEQYNPTAYIVEAKSLGWGFLAQAWFSTAAISLVLLVLGMWIFHQREIAKTTE